MKRPREAFCYQIPLTLPVVTFITAERMVPKSDFTSESARRCHWRCNRRKRGGRRQTSMLTVAWEKGKWLREKENGLVLLPKPSLKLLSRWGRWGQTHSFQDVLVRFPCQMGKMKSSHQMTAKSTLVFPPGPSSCLKQRRKSSPKQLSRQHTATSLNISEMDKSDFPLPQFLPSVSSCVAVWRTSFWGQATLPYIWKVGKEWEPPNLYLHVSIIIISSWQEPTPSRLTGKFCCIQSWVKTEDLSEGLFSKFRCSPLS